MIVSRGIIHHSSGDFVTDLLVIVSIHVIAGLIAWLLVRCW